MQPKDIGVRLQTKTSRPVNSRDKEMLRVKCKTICNRSQYILKLSETSSPTTASSGYTNTPENQHAELKSFLIKTIQSFKEDIKSSLKEIQESKGKQVKKLNKVIQELKEEVETKKTQMEANL